MSKRDKVLGQLQGLANRYRTVTTLVGFHFGNTVTLQSMTGFIDQCVRYLESHDTDALRAILVSNPDFLYGFADLDTRDNILNMIDHACPLFDIVEYHEFRQRKEAKLRR